MAELGFMQHRDIWRGIDQLAAHYGLTASGLARRAGLDPTAFNPSKREGADGRPRWPSTESLARVLDAVGAGFDDFAALVDGRRGAIAPLIGFAQAGRDGFFDDAGFPVGEGWEEVRFPGLGTDPVYALEISGNSMEPAYRAGDRIIVAPGAEVKTGDRVVARTTGGEVMAKVLARRNSRMVALASLNPDYPTREFKPNEIAWIARILWASQ
jgi:phage repressor protein C with HTH and peptisase S24 domain